MNKELMLLRTFDVKSAWFYEAFVNHDTNKLDYQYFVDCVGESLSAVKLKQAVKEVLGGTDVFTSPGSVSTISKEKFLSEYYECAKFLFVKDWIRFLWETKRILITRKDLFSWVYDLHPPKRAGYTDFTGWEDKVHAKRDVQSDD